MANHLHAVAINVAEETKLMDSRDPNSLPLRERRRKGLVEMFQIISFLDCTQISNEFSLAFASRFSLCGMRCVISGKTAA